MIDRVNQGNESAIGTDIVTGRLGPNAVYKNYLIERPGHTKSLRAVEAILDISVTLSHPVGKVWPIFKNWNLWMNRFGYEWDGLPADNENNFVYLRNTGASNDLQYAKDRTTYIVRKVIQEQLIYLESLPTAIVGKDEVWTGHNVLSLKEENGTTTVSVFMEHAWYSETLSIDDLRAEARGLMFDSAVGFWRDYFVPDLTSLVETGKVAAA